MAEKKQKIIIFLTSLLVGIMIFLQNKAYQEIGGQEIRESESNIFRVINVYLHTNQQLKDVVAELNTELKNYENEYNKRQLLEKTLTQNELLAGTTKAKGSGIKITLNKKINTLGLVDLANELWNVGAELIAINNLRITENNAGFADFSGIVTLNGVPLNPPLIIEVIGDSQSIIKALEQPGGIISRLQKKDPEIKFNIEEKKIIEMERVIN